MKKAGRPAVEKLVGGQTNGGNAAADDIDPKAYVDALLEVHKRNSNTVTRSFRGDSPSKSQIFLRRSEENTNHLLNSKCECISASLYPP